MIKTEPIGNRIKTYSDSGKMIRQIETGILYISAVDVPGKYTYEETDEDIPDSGRVERPVLERRRRRGRNESKRSI